MTGNQQFLPEIFADAILDLHFEGGVFRLTLAQFVPQQESPTDSSSNVLMPKATLLLTEHGFGSLCEVVDHVRSEVAKREEEGEEEAASSPNFE